jgi:hypothetical protein
LLRPLTLTETDPRAAAVLLNEFDASFFESLPHDYQRGSTWVTYTSFYLPDGHNTDACLTGEILLAPIEETPSRPALRRCDHRSRLLIFRDSINSIEKRLTCL